MFLLWCELWTTSQTAETIRNAFERKVLRKIYGRVLAKRQWRNGNNNEKTPVGGPRVEDEGRKGAEESTETIHRREKTGRKT